MEAVRRRTCFPRSFRKSWSLTIPGEDEAAGLTPRVCVTTAARFPSASIVASSSTSLAAPSTRTTPGTSTVLSSHLQGAGGRCHKLSGPLRRREAAPRGRLERVHLALSTVRRGRTDERLRLMSSRGNDGREDGRCGCPHSSSAHRTGARGRGPVGGVPRSSANHTGPRSSPSHCI